MGYTKETAKGITWMGFLRGSIRGIGFVKTILLARLLTPFQFGLFGVAALVLALLEILTETGINVFLVQEKGDIKKYLDTAWVTSIVRGFLITCIIVVSAPLVSLFFKSPDSLKLLLLISVVPLLRGFINPSIVKFQKDLTFKYEFVFRFSIYLFDAIVAIFLAFLTKSAVSIVFGQIAGALLEIVLSYIFVKPLPKIRFELEKVKKVVERGKWITAAGLFNYLFENIDDILVGRIINTQALGIYQVAYKISSLPINEVGAVFGKVTFPVYSKIEGDRKRLLRAFLRITGGISVLVIPFGLMLFLFTKELVLIVLGENWLTAVPVIKVLSIFGVIRSITGSSSALFLGVKKQEYVTGVTLLSILGMAIPIIPLIYKYGIVGAGISALIGSIVAIPLIIFYLLKVFKNEES